MSCFYLGFLTFGLAAGTFILIVFSQSRMEPVGLWLGLSRRSQQWASPTVCENVSDKKGGSGARAQVSGQQRRVQAGNRRSVPRQTAAGHPGLRSLWPAQAEQRVDEECGTDRNFHHLRTQVSLIVWVRVKRQLTQKFTTFSSLKTREKETGSGLYWFWSEMKQSIIRFNTTEREERGRGRSKRG